MTTPSEQNDPRNPWGWSAWLNHAKWKDSLDRKLAHKSLGIPDSDEMHVDNRRYGIDWRALAVLGASALGGYAIYQHQPLAQPPAVEQQVGPIDSEYEVRFYDADGNRIDIPQRRPGQ